MGIDLGTTYSCVGIFKDGEAGLVMPFGFQTRWDMVLAAGADYCE